MRTSQEVQIARCYGWVPISVAGTLQAQFGGEMAKVDGSGEPAAIWATQQILFDNEIPNSQNVILSQASAALVAICWRIADLQRLLTYLPGVYLHPQIPHVLSELFFHQGVASTIMFNNSTKGASETKVAFDHRIFRYEYVRRLCAAEGLETPILANRKMRNQIVHIDEHLRKAMTQPNTGWFIDCALASRDGLAVKSDPNTKTGFCRTFIVEEQVLAHLDSEVSIRDLYKEVAGILAVVFGRAPGEPPAVAGAT